MKTLYDIDEKTHIDEFGVDHSNFSLRDEIEYNFMRANQPMPKQQNPVRQVIGTVTDMVRNYIDMRLDNTVGNDDYFHCKANYEAADRGNIGRSIAQWLGNKKEDFDYYKNQIRGFSPREASIDRIHDRKVNQIGRQRAQSNLYSNSRNACESFRVRGINEKY